jgi:hypothetical protein
MIASLPGYQFPENFLPIVLTENVEHENGTERSARRASNYLNRKEFVQPIQMGRWNFEISGHRGNT